MTLLQHSHWHPTDEIPLDSISSGDALRAAAARAPQRIALIDADGEVGQRRRWTYAELLQESELLARAFSATFEPGSHVAVWAANCPEWIFVQFGLALSGMVMVTVNPALQSSELGYVLRQSKSRAVFHQVHYRGLDMGAAIREASAAEQLTLECIVCLDKLGEFSARAAVDSELPIVDPRAPAMIQYTSGTTGQPKGALLNHYSVTNNSRIMALLKELDEQTINLAVAPLFHTAGCVAGVLGCVQTGGCLLLPSAFDAASMLDLIEQEHVTYTFAVPTMLIALLAKQTEQPRDLSSLKTVFSGAATVPVEVVRKVEADFDARLIIGYGQTETSPGITHTRLDDDPVDKSETIGRPLPQVEVKIIDPATGAIQPFGVPGELCTRGFLLMMGYFEMPEATAATIDEDGWLHTGDLCAMDDRGYCRITGRLKDLIIRGGENIYPREIEEVLYTHPAITEVAVIGLPDEYWGESVAAVVSFASGKHTDGETLQTFVAGKLASHKIPRDWFVLGEIPATASGKLQKFRLLEMFKDGDLETGRI